MARIIVIVTLLLAIYFLLRYVNTLGPQDMKKFWWRFGFGLVFVAVCLLAATGRLHYIAAIATALIPFAKKLLPLIRYVPVLRKLYKQAQASKQPDSGQQSEVETSLMRMTLDHDSGDLDGDILQGEFAGKRLSDLDESALKDLLSSARASYHDSVELLEAYLDRRYGNSWREADADEQDSAQQARSFDAEMTVSEAYSILGLSEEADAEAVRRAHRSLMQKLHPDRGGNDYLAAKINQAKDLLLKHL